MSATAPMHTPGPWSVGTAAGDWHIWAPGTPRIAIVPLRHVSINEQRANAALIAAAPDMLAALREYRDAFTALTPRQQEIAAKAASLLRKVTP